MDTAQNFLESKQAQIPFSHKVDEEAYTDRGFISNFNFLRESMISRSSLMFSSDGMRGENGAAAKVEWGLCSGGFRGDGKE